MKAIMTGVLVNPKHEGLIASRLAELLWKFSDGKSFSVMVFSLPNINLADKTVNGSNITENGKLNMKAPLPDTVLNFSVQHTTKDIKKLRALMEVENLTIINSANVYNQWAVMELLLSGADTRDYILPFLQYGKDDICFDFSKGNYILKPLNGVKLSKILYLKKSGSGFDVISKSGVRFCHMVDIQEYINNYTEKGRWILMPVPELITSNNSLLIIRTYLVKKSGGEWEILFKAKSPKNARLYDRLVHSIDGCAKRIISYAGCFFPDLGYCYTDLVFNNKGLPCFLNFGGFDSRLITSKYSGADKKTAENILELSAKND